MGRSIDARERPVSAKAWRVARGIAVAIVTTGATGVLGAGCLTRPVSTLQPTTKTNFTAALQQSAVERVDLLFAIDNSTSMGDKQAYLAAAVPDLVQRLVTPNCVDGSGNVLGQSDANGNCTMGQVEFPPVHDMHVGIVSTSLGSRGGDICTPITTPITTPMGNSVSYHEDDRGELLNRSGDAETPLSDAGSSNFLAWFPTVAANSGVTPSANAPPITSATQYNADFADLVQGVAVYGCGIESQLESWYRFLIQPDPYDSITVTNGQAQWVGVDQTILQQRHDFLRPDSLVAIVVLTDENDSEIDVRSFGGTGYEFMRNEFQPPHGTAICATDPDDPGCQICSASTASDPGCMMGDYTEETDWGFNANLRHVHMKQKYGTDTIQFPIQRYVLGLTSPTIPDRNGEYPAGAGTYQGLTNLDCTNPLFAANLPDGTVTDPGQLCNLPRSGRSPSLIFYAHIGGVPHQLLQAKAGVDPECSPPNVPAGTAQADCPQKETLTTADWVSILGTDPLNYNYTGIDPHMIESYEPRAGLPGPMSANNADPINGREWITNQDPREVLPVDREYACMFPVTPRDCTNPAVASAGCDCPGGLSPEDTPPVCDTTTDTTQDNAKAYPTIRELLLGQLMGTQGVVSSLCPIHTTDNAAGDDPLYGYRPAMNAIVDRLKSALAGTCLPQQLQPDSTGAVPCLVLITLPTGSGESACNGTALTVPPEDVLGGFQAEQHANWLAAGGAQSGTTDPSTLPTCQVSQLTGSALTNGTCSQSSQPGWCYVTGTNAGSCSQEILFSPGTLPAHAEASFQCIEATISPDQ